MAKKIKPLTDAENLLLEAFLGCLDGSENGKEIFHATCDMLEGLTQAVKAKVKIDKLKQASKVKVKIDKLKK